MWVANCLISCTAHFVQELYNSKLTEEKRKATSSPTILKASLGFGLPAYHVHRSLNCDMPYFHFALITLLAAYSTGHVSLPCNSSFSIWTWVSQLPNDFLSPSVLVLCILFISSLSSSHHDFLWHPISLYNNWSNQHHLTLHTTEPPQPNLLNYQTNWLRAWRNISDVSPCP